MIMDIFDYSRPDSTLILDHYNNQYLQKMEGKNEQAFLCDVCYKRFKSKSNMVQHKRTVHSEHPLFSCDECNQSFNVRSSLIRHKKAIHSDERPFLCTSCDKSFKTKGDLKAHSTNHLDVRPHPCLTCGLSFAKKSILHEHITNRHTTDRPHKCQVCHKGFKIKRDLNRHSKLHLEVLPFPCSSCDKKYATKQSLDYHQVRNHNENNPEECSICGKYFKTKSDLTRHAMTHWQSEDFTCRICKKEFTTRRNLKRHELGHKRPFECFYCHKRFRYKDYIKIHIYGHLNFRPHVCSLCDKAFVNIHSLNKHKNSCKINGHVTKRCSRRSSNRSHKCEVCQEEFTNKRDLKRHSKIHIEESTLEAPPSDQTLDCSNQHQFQHHNDQSYKCLTCRMTFETEADLSSHSMIHSKSASSVCRLCDEKFTDKDVFKRHKLNHKLHFKCFYCKKQFGDKSHLKFHIYGHLNVCSSCGESFINASRLNKHKESCKKNGSFECSICDRKYTTQAFLDRHYRELHTITTELFLEQVWEEPAEMSLPLDG